MSLSTDKPKLVLHICCAICGAYLSELLKDRFEIIYYYYNPNIHPEKEYIKRRESVQKLASIYSSEFIEGDYETQEWYSTIAGFEGEPEGGKRCPLCFRMRIAKTATLALAKGATHFTTTLAASPHKNEDIIGAIGADIATERGLAFLTMSDFGEPKKEMWTKTRVLAKEHGFYHQNYCGCTFSIWKK
jgi:predicted adenine nucleotide alpha hydrolase (AANH) superfamily ATPase